MPSTERSRAIGCYTRRSSVGEIKMILCYGGGACGGSSMERDDGAVGQQPVDRVDTQCLPIGEVSNAVRSNRVITAIGLPR